jgi:hypothetical protein
VLPTPYRSSSALRTSVDPPAPVIPACVEEDRIRTKRRQIRFLIEALPLSGLHERTHPLLLAPPQSKPGYGWGDNGEAHPITSVD